MEKIKTYSWWSQPKEENLAVWQTWSIITNKKEKSRYSLTKTVIPITSFLFQWIICIPVSVFLRFFLRWNVEGRDCVKKALLKNKTVIFGVMPHTTYFDGFPIPISLPRLIPIYFVCAMRFFKNPVSKFLFLLTGIFPTKAKNTKRPEKGLNYGSEILEKHSLVVFPQGKIQRTADDVEIRTGMFYLAQKTGRPIIPTKYIGTLNLDKDGNIKAYHSDLRFYLGFRRLTIVYGEPIYVRSFNDEYLDAKERDEKLQLFKCMLEKASTKSKVKEGNKVVYKVADANERLEGLRLINKRYLEVGYLESETPEEMFSDEYVENSVYFVAKAGEKVVGAMRIVKYSAKELPMLKNLPIYSREKKKIRQLSKNKVVEVGNLAAIPGNRVALGLYKSALKYSIDNGYNYWLAGIDFSLFNYMHNKYKLVRFKKIGECKEYMGSLTIPISLKINFVVKALSTFYFRLDNIRKCLSIKT